MRNKIKKPQTLESVSVNYKSLRSVRPVKVVQIIAGMDKRQRHLSCLLVSLEFILKLHKGKS